MQEWSLRNEIYTALHRWPLILLYCLVGCSLGVLLALVWPTPWRATAEIYVGIEPYRWSEDENVVAYAMGTRFNYADDYKNWQMSNLNALVSMDDIRLKTLERLRASSDYWSDINRRALSDMLQVFWRNPGRWRLVAEHTDPEIAQAAASVWREVVYETVQESIKSAQDTFKLDIQLKAIQKEQVDLSTHLAKLDAILAGLSTTKTRLEDLPVSQPVDELNHWQLWSWAAGAAQYNPVWVALLNDLPPGNEKPEVSLAWLEKARLAVEEDIQITQAQIDTLAGQQAQATADYAIASQASRGLSANMQLEKTSEILPAPQAIRPTGLMALIGAIFGFLAWAILWLIRLSLRKTG
jgi:hypothetical protein